MRPEKLLLLSTVLIVLPVTAARADVDTSISSQESSPETFQALANARNGNYGHELFLRGDYDEAARVFQHILENDCGDAFAQYHLRQISLKSLNHKYLESWLDQHACAPRDASPEAGLPSLLKEASPAPVMDSATGTRVSSTHLNEKIDNNEQLMRDIEKKAYELNKKIKDMTGRTATCAIATTGELPPAPARDADRLLTLDKKMGRLQADLEYIEQSLLERNTREQALADSLNAIRN